MTDPAPAGPRAGEMAARPRVLLFTGKGGVGKTTTAAATALACADRGLRTLVVSTDPAHSLADALGQPLGDRPTPVDGLLQGQQLDARRRLEEQWGELRGFLADILDWAGVRAIEAEELTLLPGLEEILSLTDLVTHAGSGAWDVVVVDCAPTAETLRLLSLPDILSWCMDRLFPITKQITSLVGPVVRGLTAIPVADDEVFGSVERLYHRLAAVRELLADGEVTTVRLVVNPEKMVIAEARRTATYLSLFGYRVDAVIVNRLLPDEVTDPWFDHHRAAQVEHLAAVEEGFAPVPVLRCPLAEREPVGLELLRPFAQGLYGDLDPSARLHDGEVLDVRRDGGRWVLGLTLPVQRPPRRVPRSEGDGADRVGRPLPPGAPAARLAAGSPGARCRGARRAAPGGLRRARVASPRCPSRSRVTVRRTTRCRPAEARRGIVPAKAPGTEALQAAALQAIAAAKAFLDLAEQAVRDPEVLGQVASSLSAVAKGVLGGLVPPGAQGRSSGSGGDPGDTPLEHIDVG